MSDVAMSSFPWQRQGNNQNYGRGQGRRKKAAQGMFIHVGPGQKAIRYVARIAYLWIYTGLAQPQPVQLEKADKTRPLKRCARPSHLRSAQVEARVARRVPFLNAVPALRVEQGSGGSVRANSPSEVTKVTCVTNQRSIHLNAAAKNSRCIMGWGATWGMRLLLLRNCPKGHGLLAL